MINIDGNKSLQYIIDRINDDPDSVGIVYECKDTLTAMNLLDYCKQTGNDKVFQLGKPTAIMSPVYQQVASIEYNPGADFNYFTIASMTSNINDATYSFFADLAANVVGKVMNMQTQYTPVLEQYPYKDEDFLEHYMFKYTVGDLILGQEYSNNLVTDGQPVPQCRFVVLLPIKFEIIDKSTVPAISMSVTSKDDSVEEKE